MSKIKYEIIFEERTIYIGDAAHSFHPIAGQGWNLGVSDIEKLFTLAEEYKKLCFICFKVDELITLTEYHFKFSKLLEKNKLIYKLNDFSKILSKELLKEIITNNENFYREIDKF